MSILTTNLPNVEDVEGLNNQRLLTLEEALLCLPPPAFIKKLTKSIPNLGDHVPDDVFLWDDFLESVRMYEFTDEKRYQRPQFSRSRSGVETLELTSEFPTVLKAYEKR
ncbi:unnamed protein product [Rhizophagus irregularis]|nr:unnamed protein product [Rhizophagus irregularis]